MDRSLAALIHVVEAGSVTRAADRIGLAQPSLTKRLKLLEEEYNVPLFERQPNGMVPTEFGTALYRRAKAIEQQLHQAGEELSALKTGEMEVLRVGSGPVIRNYLLRTLFPKLRQQFPNMRLEFRDDIHQKRLQLVEDGELDIFFGLVSTDTDLDGIAAFPVVDLTHGVLAHESHPLFARKDLTPGDLTDVDWVRHDDGGLSHTLDERYFRRYGGKMPKYSITTTSLEFGMELLADGQFVMAGAVQLAEAFSSLGIKALPLKEPIDEIPISAYMRASTSTFPAVQYVVELITEETAEA